MFLKFEKNKIFLKLGNFFCLQRPLILDHFFTKSGENHQNGHILEMKLLNFKTTFFFTNLLRHLHPCKYRYHTIISGKNIKDKKLVSKIAFLGYLKILDLAEKKKH